MSTALLRVRHLRGGAATARACGDRGRPRRAGLWWCGQRVARVVRPAGLPYPLLTRTLTLTLTPVTFEEQRAEHSHAEHGGRDGRFHYHIVKVVNRRPPQALQRKDIECIEGHKVKKLGETRVSVRVSASEGEGTRKAGLPGGTSYTGRARSRPRGY